MIWRRSHELQVGESWIMQRSLEHSLSLGQSSKETEAGKYMQMFVVLSGSGSVKNFLDNTKQSLCVMAFNYHVSLEN